MIEVIEGYVIDVDSLNYTLKKDTGRLDKDGNKVYRTYGYHSSLKSALVACIGCVQKEKLSNGTLTLEQAINVSNQAVNRFNELLELAIKEVKEDE